MTFEGYYASTFQQWVDRLDNRIHNQDEAEDRIQSLFLELFRRKEFCEDLIEKREMDAYMYGCLSKLRAQVFREGARQIPTVSLDADNMDLLSLLASSHRGSEAEEKAELDSFYKAAMKLLENLRKPQSDCGFDSIGELRRYILIRYAQSGLTFQEIADLTGMTYQNVSEHYRKITLLILPAIEDFMGKKLKITKNGLNISEN